VESDAVLCRTSSHGVGPIGRTCKEGRKRRAGWREDALRDSGSATRARFREETGDETTVARTASAAQLADDIAVIMRGNAMALCGPPETVTACQASTVLTYVAPQRL
jgi:hypothetical protein